MAAYDTLRAAIDNYIKANRNKEITGTVLNDILNAMVSALGADTRFAGVAVPTTNPGNPEGNVVYFASQAGTYSNFGGIVLPLGIHILVWNGTAWTSQTWFSVDNTPTQNSQNLATSGGILQAIVDAVGVERLRAIGAEVTSCSFDGTTKKISFFNSADDTLFQLDATAFVIDGMVSDVKIEDGNLVIQFNTDAGKQDIEIPLTDIFNPANYYTKTAIDALLELYYTKTETDAFLTAINNNIISIIGGSLPEVTNLISQFTTEGWLNALGNTDGQAPWYHTSRIEVNEGDIIEYSVYGHPNVCTLVVFDASQNVVDYIKATSQSSASEPSTAFKGSYTIQSGQKYVAMSANFSENAAPWQIATLTTFSQVEGRLPIVEDKVDNLKENMEDIIGVNEPLIIDIVPLCENNVNGYYNKFGAFNSGGNYYTNGNGQNLTEGLLVHKGDIVNYSIYGHPNCANILAINSAGSVVDYVVATSQSSASDPSTAFVGSYTVQEGTHHLIFSLNLGTNAKPWQNIKLTRIEHTDGRLDVVEKKVDELSPEKVQLSLVAPKVLYTVCNNVGQDGNFPRNYSSRVFIDHMINGITSEPDFLFEESSDCVIVSSKIATDTYNGTDFPVPVYNEGQNILEKTITKKIKGKSIQDATFSFVHRSTLNSPTANYKPRVLVFGDSITNGELARIFEDDYAQKYVYHTICKKLFDLDKIDNNDSGFDCLFLGAKGRFSNTYTYKGSSHTSYSNHQGVSGMNIDQFIVAPEYQDENSQWSLEAFINRYRTMDDNGDRLSIDSPNIGASITSSNINTIDICTPTHVVIAFGMNSGGETSKWVQIVNTIKTEFPNMIIGIVTFDCAGTNYPSLYPSCDKTCTLYNITGTDNRHSNKWELSGRLQEEFFKTSYENNNVYWIPLYWVGLTADGVGMLNRPTANGEVIKTSYGYLPHVHSNGHSHIEWAYQLYSWIKYTIAKNL